MAKHRPIFRRRFPSKSGRISSGKVVAGQGGVTVQLEPDEAATHIIKAGRLTAPTIDDGIDLLSSRAARKKAARRVGLLQKYPHDASPYSEGRHQASVEDILLGEERREAAANALRSILLEFKHDRSVRAIFFAISKGIPRHSNRLLAAATGLSLAQVKAAKERLRYHVRAKSNADSFENYLDQFVNLEEKK